MREGPFELVIVREDGTPFQEHMVNGKPMLVAEPDAAYRVSLTIHPDETGKSLTERIIADLHVDGRFANGQRIDLTGRFACEHTYMGYFKNSTDYAAFVFSFPEAGPAHDKENTTSWGNRELHLYL